MDDPGAQPDEESIGALFARLIEDGRAYAKAELALLAAILRHRGQRAGRAMAALGAAFVLALAATMALVVGLVLGLATLIGPVGAGLAIAAALGGTAYLCLRIGLAGLSGLGSDQAERDAIERGKR